MCEAEVRGSLPGLQEITQHLGPAHIVLDSEAQVNSGSAQSPSKATA